MIVAQNRSGHRINALHMDADEAICPECRDSVIPKRGEIMRAHFAHRPGSACVLATTGESVWHREWKWLLMMAGWDVEVTIGGHRADAERMGQVVEIQSRPLDRETVHERADEYGPGLVWIIKAINSRSIKINETRGEVVGFRNSLIWLIGCQRPVIVDCGPRAYLLGEITQRWYENDDGNLVRYAAAQIIESFDRVVLGVSRNFPRLVERLAKRSASFGPSLWDRTPANLWLDKGRRLAPSEPLMELRYAPIVRVRQAA